MSIHERVELGDSRLSLPKGFRSHMLRGGPPQPSRGSPIEGIFSLSISI